MTVLHTQLVALAMTALVLTASGCGGSSKEEPAKTPTSTSSESGQQLTLTQFIAKGEAICAHANAQRHSHPLASTREDAPIFALYAGYDRLEAAELSKLMPPPSMAKDLEHFLAGLEAFGKDTAKLAVYARTEDNKSGTALLTAAGNIHNHLTAIAKRDGLKECATA